MGHIFHFRKKETGFFGYLKDTYSCFMALFLLSGITVIAESPSDLMNYYVALYAGLSAIYWTPIVQRMLDFERRVWNYFFFLSQFAIPFLANAALVGILIHRWFGKREIREREEIVESTNKIEDLEDANSENKDLRETLERLELTPKGSLLYRTSWLRLLTVVATLGAWALIADRWSKEDVDILYRRAESTLSKRKLLESDHHLCSSSEKNLLAIPHEKKLKFFKVESESLEISKYSELNFRNVKDKEKHNSYELSDRQSEREIIELKFDSSDNLGSFLKSLGAELNKNGLYHYRNIWDDEEAVKEMARADIGIKNNFQNLSPYEFEEFVADLFDKIGYKSRVTSKSGDFGVDVIAENGAERIAIQAKRHKPSNKVGAPTVQKTLGSKHKAKADKTMIVTTSYFTGPAHKQARNGPIELWNKDILHKKVENYYINLN